MVLKQLKGTGPGVIFFIAVLLMAFWSGALLFSGNPALSVYDSNPLPLYSLLLAISGKVHLAGLLLSFVLAGLTAIVLVNFNTSDFFIGERTFLPAFFYVLLTGFLSGMQHLNPVLPASFLLLLAIIRINGSYRVEGVAYNFFDAGLLIGAGSLFYANLAWFFVLLIIGLAIYRSFNIIEIIISIIGVIVPWALTFGYYYLSGKSLKDLIGSAGQGLFGESQAAGYGTIELIILITAGAVVLLSIAYLFMDMGKMKIKSRKTFYLLAWVFVMTAIIFMIVPSASADIAWIAIFPLSYFLSYFFLNVRKKTVRATAFYLFFALAIAMQVLYFLRS